MLFYRANGQPSDVRQGISWFCAERMVKLVSEAGVFRMMQRFLATREQGNQGGRRVEERAGCLQRLARG